MMFCDITNDKQDHWNTNDVMEDKQPIGGNNAFDAGDYVEQVCPTIDNAKKRAYVILKGSRCPIN